MADHDIRPGTVRGTTTATDTPYRDSTATTTAYRDTPVHETHVHETSDAAGPHRQHHVGVGSKNILDWLALILLIVGGLNWGLVGLFGFDLVAAIFGSGTTIARAIYIAVGVAAIWGFALMRLAPSERH